jgi:glutamyl-tRNA reductase
MLNSWHVTCPVLDARWFANKLGNVAIGLPKIFSPNVESIMNLILAGVSHKTSPLEVREKFALSEERIPGALRALHAEPEVEEAAIISTCNRVEFVVQSYEGQDGLEALRRFLESALEIRFDDYAHCFYVHRDYEAVRHLFRVASGLDSMVIGEPQILGQVKRAHSLAQEAETCGSVLEPVFNRVFFVAKRVRTETRVAESHVSVSSAAVEMAEKAYGDLRQRSVMIIGAGQMGELAARTLVAKGASTVLVSNRTQAQAVALAREPNGLAIHFSRIWEGMKGADIVICSTGCPHFIITRHDIERLMSEREGRPLFLIDIAVPRDIDPRVREVPGCALVDIDGLQQTASANLRERQEAVDSADRIVCLEAEMFRERQAQLHVVPTIVSLRRRVEQIRRAELARARGLFGSLTADQEKALEILTQGLVNKILHTPFTELKHAAARPDRSEFLDVVRTIFHLEEDEVSLAIN